MYFFDSFYLHIIAKKFFMKKILYISAFTFLLSSCGSLTRISREEVETPLIYSTREDISITDDLTASGKVRNFSILFIDFYRWNDSKRQLKIGPFRFLDREYEEGTFNGYNGLGSTFDERIAVYNFINENSKIDYVTNIRYKKLSSRKPFYLRLLNIGVREMETTIIAKGVILKNKVSK
jgi:hypothetical protein